MEQDTVAEVYERLQKETLPALLDKELNKQKEATHLKEKRTLSLGSSGSQLVLKDS